MTRDDDADGVFADGRPDRSHSPGRADPPRNLGVRDGLAERNGLQFFPDALLKRRAVKIERQIELSTFSVHVFAELSYGCRQHARPGTCFSVTFAPAAQCDRGDPARSRGDAERAELRAYGDFFHTLMSEKTVHWSVIFRMAPGTLPSTALPVTSLSVRFTFSSPSTNESFTTGTANDLLDSPEANVNVPMTEV